MNVDEPQFTALFGGSTHSYESLYRQVLDERQRLYNAVLSSGRYTPFLLPWDLIPVFLLTTGVALTPRLPSPISKPIRYLILVLELAYFATRWSQTRTLGMACGYGIGLASQWGAIMTLVLLILHDPGRDFARLEVRPINDAKAMDSLTNTNGRVQSVDLRNRRVYGMHGTIRKPTPTRSELAASRPYRIVWQGYPQHFWHLMDWSFDLMTSFRGLNWNFRARSFPAPDIPLPVLDMKQKDATHTDASSKPTAVPWSTLKEIQTQAIRDFVCYYVFIDFLKTCMATEPYFLGITPLSSPTTWSWLATINETVPFATRFVRLCISLAGVAAALTFVFSLAPLCFAIIIPVILGDRLAQITKNPLLEPWMYPPQWGSMLEALRTKGLAGMWGQWWHQMFRYGISEPSRAILEKLKIDGQSQLGRSIKLFVAFGLSGALHAAASSTTFSIIPSRPLMPLLFFLSQGIGIAIQTELSKRINKQIQPGLVSRQVGNLCFVLIWLWYTGPLLANDFARCGIWLFEPVPFSIFRGLGFGPGDIWFPWLGHPEGGRWVGWWNGDTWYRCGLAVF